ncbi:unnamed protein product [Ectocarpus sp. 12 AP-2014]
MEWGAVEWRRGEARDELILCGYPLPRKVFGNFCGFFLIRLNRRFFNLCSE